ncbi:hypothetical protein BB560_006097 [Smittium megazygosporum]|uniref:Zn(2)-C6 fungal-type domain-containing protein n=1 Tax=Smittium megazygosporum TaxID=133381 RepID=A0A2T9YHS1_9FUNG|nr:hypothetical protein BB560_006097 [Smittium megazygosporum]
MGDPFYSQNFSAQALNSKQFDLQSSSNSQTPISTPQLPTDLNKRTTTTKGKRKKVQRACVYCRRSHMTCDVGRPCQRCIKRDIPHLCRDESDTVVTTKKKSAKTIDQAETLNPSIQIKPSQQPTTVGSQPPNLPEEFQITPNFNQINNTLVNQASDNLNFDQVSIQKVLNSSITGYSQINEGISLNSTDKLYSSTPSTRFNSTIEDSSIPSLENSHYDQFGAALPQKQPSNYSNMPFDNQLKSNISLNLFNNTSKIAGLITDVPHGLDNRGVLFRDPKTIYTQPNQPLLDSSKLHDTSNNFTQPDPFDSNKPEFNSIPQTDLKNPIFSSTKDVPIESRSSEKVYESISDLFENKTKELRNKYQAYSEAVLEFNSSTFNDNLEQLLMYKFEAGLLKPHSYVGGYMRMHKFIEKRMSTENVTKLVGIMRIYRPAFQVIIRSLSDIDMLASEITFERQLSDYDYVFSSFSVPACLWRRSGEIYKANKQFADLVGIPLQYLREGRIAIYELLTEDSYVNYFEKYTSIAFDVTQKAVLTSCTLEVSDSVREMIEKDRELGLWKKDVHKDLKILPLYIGAYNDIDYKNDQYSKKQVAEFFKEFWDTSKKIDKSKLTADFIFDSSKEDKSIFITDEHNDSEFLSAKVLLEGEQFLKEENAISSQNTTMNGNFPTRLNGGPNDNFFELPKFPIGYRELSHFDESCMDDSNKNSYRESGDNSFSVQKADQKSEHRRNSQESESKGKLGSRSSESDESSSKLVGDCGIPRKKIRCCFSLTVRRDKNCLPIAIIGNFIPIDDP